MLLWCLESPQKLEAGARSRIVDPNEVVWVSAASLWEMSIKQALGKLECPDDLMERLEAMQFAVLPVDGRHALAVKALPPVHRDPFDRMLIAQAQVEQLCVVTRDPRFRDYPSLEVLMA